MTTGTRTLLLNGMIMWSQMIDKLFWTFSMKAIAESLNILQIYHKGRTPEYIIHLFKVEDIPVKSFHTLLSPIYVLDDGLQNSEGAGLTKLEPCSHIGVHLGHSPLHAGSVALLWNPTTGCFSQQYHVVFDDEFSTVPYTEAGNIPPIWENLEK